MKDHCFSSRPYSRSDLSFPTRQLRLRFCFLTSSRRCCLFQIMRNYGTISSVSLKAWAWKLFQFCPQSKWPRWKLTSTVFSSAPLSHATKETGISFGHQYKSFWKRSRLSKESFCVQSISWSRWDEQVGQDKWIPSVLSSVLSLLTWFNLTQVRDMFYNDSGSKIVSRPSRFSVLRNAMIEVMRPGFDINRKRARSPKSVITNARESMIKVDNGYQI